MDLLTQDHCTNCGGGGLIADSEKDGTTFDRRCPLCHGTGFAQTWLSFEEVASLLNLNLQSPALRHARDHNGGS